MSPPKVFISATSADLGPTRQVVKEALLTIGCMPVEQTSFPPDWRTVSQMLREKISDCQALIHIAGLHYGAEPDPSSLPTGDPRRSYTQMEYDIACELQRERGRDRFHVYRFICIDDFPYRTVPEPESDELGELQTQHRIRIMAGEALYERPPDPYALEKRVLALSEPLSRLSQSDAEAVATRLTQDIHARFKTDAEAARAAGAKWEAMRDLERNRDAALASVDAVIRTIKDGLAGKPVPIFTEATRILEDEGADAALGYLESHKIDQLGRADRAAAQVEAAQEALQRELQPLMLQAELHQTQLEWDEALDLMQAVADKSPQWFQVRNRLGLLLKRLAHYTGAETHQRAALSLAKTPVEEAIALNGLAHLLQATNRLAEAEPMMRRALAVNEASYGSEHPEVALNLNNLATLLYSANRLAEAEPMMRRALAINEANYGSEHPDVASNLNNLAALLQATNRLAEAEPMMRRALAINEASYGSEHPNVAIRLNNLALLLKDTNRLTEAEPLFRRALAINEASYGREHPDVAGDLNNLAQLLDATNRLAEAEPMMRRALAINEESYGSDHPEVAVNLNNLAHLLKATNRLAEAESMMRRALAINEASYGSEHPDVALNLNNLATLLYTTNRLAEAEPMMRHVVEIFMFFTQCAGHEHPNLRVASENYLALLAEMGRDKVEQQAAIDALKESVRKRGGSTPDD